MLRLLAVRAVAHLQAPLPPSQARKRHINMNILFGDCLGGGGGVSLLGGQGSKVYVLCAEPKEHEHFRPGARLEGSVSGVTEKLFIC